MRNVIQSIEHYDFLIKQSKLMHNSHNINCFLMPMEIKRLTDSGLLTYSESGSGLNILQDCGVYQRLYLYINPETPVVENLPDDKTITSDFIGVNGILSTKNKNTIAALEAIGFVNNGTSVRMFKQISLNEPAEEALMGGVYLSFAKKCHIPEIYDLWRESFDFAKNHVPREDELSEYIDDKSVICAFSGQRVIGVAHADCKNNELYVRHIAVSEQLRGQGIAKAMRNVIFSIAKSNGIEKVFHWVLKDINLKAIPMFLSLGYHLDTRFSEQYCLHAMSQETL